MMTDLDRGQIEDWFDSPFINFIATICFAALAASYPGC